MISKFHQITHRSLFFFLLLLFIACIFFSKYILSLSIFGLLALCFVKIDFNKTVKIKWRNTLVSGFSSMIRNPILMAVSLTFFLTLLSGIISDNSKSWLHMIKMHLPFLAIPFVFVNHHHISKNEFKWLHYFFIICCLISSAIVSIQYGLNFDSITEGIGKGKSLPVPHSPPHYSILISFGFLSGLLSLGAEKEKINRILISLACILLFLFLHFLAARAGLLAVYLGLLVFGIQKVYLKQRWAFGVTLLVLVGLFPILAYYTIQGFQKKVDYTIYDAKMRLKGEGQSYSDSERLMSIQAGLQVFKKYPLLGSGVGDLKPAMERAYDKLDFEISLNKNPHNQFVYMLAGYGLIGLAIFLVSIYWPLFYRRNYRNSYFLTFHLVIFVLFMVESPLGSSSMVAFFLLFALLNLSVLKNWEEPDHQELL